MSISYSRVNWQNDPSTQTPLSAANLNTMDKGIDDVVTAVNTLVPVEANPVGVASEDLTALDVDGTIYSVGVGIPSGGSANQILTKKSSTDYDVEWSNAPSVGGILPKLTVNTITGATVTATLGGTTVSLSETGVGTGVYEGDLTDLGTWTITVTNGETITQTLLVDTVKLYNITISSFSATIEITYPSGASCTCAGGGETQTATSNPETFTVSSADTYVITVVDNGNTYTKNIVITTDGQTESARIPSGIQALPIDDVANWLFVGGRTENYTTVSQVLADSTCLSALIASSEAVDYLVRSTGFASDITSDSGAMTLIGLNNYCANSLLDDSTWLTAICNSTYFESVLNVKVPTMTSNTTPSGTCFGDYTAQSQYDFFKVFDNNASTLANPQTNQKLGYQFTSAVRVFKMFLKNASAGNNNLVKTFKIVGSNDGSSWTDITETLTSTNQSQGGESSYVFANATAYNRYTIMPLSIVSTSTYANIAEIQFYGRADV